MAINYFMRNSKWAKPLDSYMTPLSPEKEQQFSQWAIQNQKRIGSSDVVNNPMGDYDYRGWWLANQNKTAPNGHFEDTYKTPYHETFSNESQYANPELAPQWKQSGKKWQLISNDGTILKTE